MTFFHLLLAYALAFGIQNKATFLYNRADLLDRLLACMYCLGFHCGWMLWLFEYLRTGQPPAQGWQVVPSLLVWAFVSSAFCYSWDVLVRWLESNIRGE